MKTFTVIGCGAWALSIANVLAENSHNVNLWCHDLNITTSINKTHKNPLLKHLSIHPRIPAFNDLSNIDKDTNGIIIGVASPFIDIIKKIPSTQHAPFLVLTKGLLENKNTLLLADYINEIRPNNPLALLSGPNLAQEIIEKKPAATVIASQKEHIAQFFQTALSNHYLRVYTSSDIIGVSLGGILKNIMAIAGGCIDGLKLGMNSKAALLSRSLQEMIRIGTFLGGKKESFLGLSGLGDLITTANSSLSRNWNVGYALAKGENFQKKLQQTQSIAEGIKTTKIIYELSKKHHIDMPITEQIYLALFKNKNPKDAINDLMTRKLKSEDT
ncbi:MAG: NAD(P)H-dependent glycerol-3-phosphate dehydrogenase [bacterium]